MKTQIYENKIGLQSLNQTELMEINGGSFAYDVGKSIRFLAIYCVANTITNMPGAAWDIASADWNANAEKK